MQSTKEKKGFHLDDRWILLLGIPIVGVAMPFLLSDYEILSGNIKFLHNILMSLAYTLFLWLGIRYIVRFYWKRLSWEKYPFRHIIFELITIFVYTTAVFYLLFFLERKFFPGYREEDQTITLIFIYFITFFITSLHEGWYFFRQWIYTQQKAEALLRENSISQYETLKNQINPHFLFNTLNTLSSLIEENPKTAVLFVERTADFFRRILSFNEKEIITIREELELINDFIFLQKKRYGNKLLFELNIPEEIHENAIAPLTIQMLIENAIKHNVISSENPLVIEIKVVNGINIQVRNNLQLKAKNKSSGGIGLSNICMRYDFLSPQKKVIINRTNDFFEVLIPVIDIQ